jgi:TolA-binding protein
VLLLAAAVAVLAGGCGTPKIQVDQTDGPELQAVSEYLAARTDYNYRLDVVETFYQRNGNLDKLRWARREKKNLQQAAGKAEFAWKPEIIPPQGESMVNRDERVLVESLVDSRRTFLARQKDLASFYERTDQADKRQKLARIQEAFNPVRTYMYFLDAEIPGPNLRPTVVRAEAEELYAEAMDLHKGLLSGKEEQAQALDKLLRLVRDYENSTKIALAAYFIAEIYKEHFKENIRAVHWYQRAWQWDPEIEQPARFQAAVIYDLRLHNVPKAIETYRLARKFDPYRPGNDAWARARIVDLTSPEE